MKTVGIMGSPRAKGNSAAIASHFIETAKKLGLDTAVYELNRLQFKDCQGCRACKTGAERCVLKDDLTGVLQAMEEADIVVLSTPIYVFDVPGQVKSFIDRLYSFLKPDFMTNPAAGRLAPNKKFVFVQTQGAADEKAYEDIYHKYKLVVGGIGFTQSHRIRATGVAHDEDIRKRIDVMNETEELAKRLCTGN